MVAWPIENTSPSVLIADDNERWRSTVEDILARAGFRTLEAASGEEAIKVVRGERLDVILIDFHMPRLDGIQTLRIIRREHRWPPAVLMTAEPQELPADAVRELRIQSVIVKPASRQIIVTTVTRVVMRSGPSGPTGPEPMRP
ncbi:MAG: response regulator [Planctomycetota bacterium]|nr:response regulator [Planctomycetota bacterium]